MRKVIIALVLSTLFFNAGCTLLSNDALVHKDGGASIGASIGVDKKGWLYLVDITKNGPVAKSGEISEGERLIGIKPSSDAEFYNVHKGTDTLTPEEIVNLIQGPEGSEITLRLLRHYKIFFVTLKRENISK